MPRLTQSTPKYRLHRASGRAVVTLNGTDHYLGPHNSPESRAEYDRLIAEWLAAGRSMPTATKTKPALVQELILAYFMWAEKYYRKNGEPTAHLESVRYALKPLRRLYGHTPIQDFGPLSLEAIQQSLIESEIARSTINTRISIIKRVFKWGVSKEMCPPSLHHALATVPGLHIGRSQARETKPVEAVAWSVVELTLPHMPTVTGDMVRLMWLIGCRPGELCSMRPHEVDRTGEDVWLYRPGSHKTEHHGRERTIFIGPQAQAILSPYLLRDSNEFCFQPLESERKRKAALRAARKSKVQPSQLDRSKPNLKRTFSDAYDRNTFNRAIQRACEFAFDMPKELRTIPPLKKWLAGLSGTKREVAKAKRDKLLERARAWRAEFCWSPNQLRHAAGTRIRKEFGLEAAQVILGHAKADVTQVYAERDMERAKRVAGEVG